MFSAEIFFLDVAVLGKVKDFLGIMEEANKRLELDAKVCFSSSYHYIIYFILLNFGHQCMLFRFLTFFFFFFCLSKCRIILKHMILKYLMGMTLKSLNW